MAHSPFSHPPLSVGEHISLGAYLATGLDSSARYFVEVKTTEQLLEALSFCRDNHMSYCLMGSGYSLLFPEEYQGLVIKNNCRKFELVGKRGKFIHGTLIVENAMLYAEAGALLNQIVRYTIEDGLAGLEEQLGLPGTVGGALMTEENRSEKSLLQALLSVEFVDGEGTVQEMKTGDFLKKREADKEVVILSCIFSLTSGDKKLLWEKASQAAQARIEKYPPETVISEVFSSVPLSDALRLPTPQNTQDMHTLIEKAGLLGKQIGGAKVSQVYGNTILRAGLVETKDVLALIKFMQNKLQQKFGIAAKLRLKTFTL